MLKSPPECASVIDPEGATFRPNTAVKSQYFSAIDILITHELALMAQQTAAVVYLVL